MNKTKTRTGLSALFAVLLAIMIAVPAILQSGANAAVNRKRPTKATLTSVKQYLTTRSASNGRSPKMSLLMRYITRLPIPRNGSRLQM